METYEELRRKMINAVGLERTEEIKKMAEDFKGTNMERDYEFFTHKNGVTILESDCIFWYDSIETFLDEELNQTNGASCKYESKEEARKDYEEEKLEYNSDHKMVGEEEK